MIQNIIEKYSLAPATYQKSSFNEFDNLNSYLNAKFKPYIQEGFYGFDMGNSPVKWYQAINDFLDLAIVQCPQLKILQIKQKFDGLRIYLNNVNDDVFDAATRLELLCQMKNLYD